MWRRPWLLFGLGVLAIIVIVSSFAANALVRVQRQHQILRDLERLGAGYEYAEHLENTWQIPFAWQYPREVKIDVDAYACNLNDVLDLANQLVEVHELTIRNAHTLPRLPIDQIVSLTQLEALSLIGAPLTSDNLNQLGTLKNLRTLDIQESPLRYQEVVAWSQSHLQCEVNWWPPLTLELQQARARIIQCQAVIYPQDRRAIERSSPWALGLRDVPRVWRELQQAGNIRHLIISGQQYVDWDVQQLAQLKTLRYVQITSTSVTPACIDSLATLPELEQLILADSDVSAADILRLRQSHPQIQLLHGPHSGPRKFAPSTRHSAAQTPYLHVTLVPEQL